jgi:D-glycero-alpha-D-manno-heptose-7-phosphate kinase
VAQCFDDIVAITARMRRALEAGDWPAAGACLDEEWRTRKRLAPGVTTAHIDAVLQAAKDAGAWAGKVCGAGGGGCVFCLAPPEATAAVRDALAAWGAAVLDAAVDRTGVCVERDAR